MSGMPCGLSSTAMRCNSRTESGFMTFRTAPSLPSLAACFISSDNTPFIRLDSPRSAVCPILSSTVIFASSSSILRSVSGLTVIALSGVMHSSRTVRADLRIMQCSSFGYINPGLLRLPPGGIERDQNQGDRKAADIESGAGREIDVLEFDRPRLLAFVFQQRNDNRRSDAAQEHDSHAVHERQF